MLNWAYRFNIFCFLDNRQYAFSEPAFECMLAAGSEKQIEMNAGTAFDALKRFQAANPKDWLFGHLGYDLKNEMEKLHSGHPDGTGFADLCFFIPEILVQLSHSSVTITGNTDPKAVFSDILSCPDSIKKTKETRVAIQSRIPKKEYIDTIQTLRNHILRGDCYEINFCQEFFSEDAELDPLYVYHRLAEASPNPFSAFYRTGQRFCLCASPERYLKKTGNRIFSQPIKGTSKRHLQDPLKDEAQKKYLQESHKEKSENVMVVDLVRNDLSRVCRAGTVRVDELFGLYSFPQVHQMISTVSGELEEGVDWVDCIKTTFPMGSMTGAPKVKVMELIEKYESSRRGLFSGAIGYIKPGGAAGPATENPVTEPVDFDFNVVIRTLLFNAHDKYLSFQTGGAITFYSDPEKEYEECLLKGAVINSILK